MLVCRAQTEWWCQSAPATLFPAIFSEARRPFIWGGMQATTYLQHHFFAGATWRARTSWAWLAIFKRYITAELQVGNYVSEMLGVLKHFFAVGHICPLDMLKCLENVHLCRLSHIMVVNAH